MLPVAALLFGTVTTTDVSPAVTVKVEPVGMGEFPVPVTIGRFDVIESTGPVIDETTDVGFGMTVVRGPVPGITVVRGSVPGPVTPDGMIDEIIGFTDDTMGGKPPVGVTCGIVNPPVPVIVGIIEPGLVMPVTTDSTDVRTLVMSVPGRPVRPVPIGRPPVGSTLGRMLVGRMPPVGNTLGIMLPSGPLCVVSGPELPLSERVGSMPPVGSTLGMMLASGPLCVVSGPELPVPVRLFSMLPVGRILGTTLFSRPDGVESGPELPVPGKVKVGTIGFVV